MKIKTIPILSTLGLGLLSQSLWAGDITAINIGSLPNQQRLIKIQFDKDVALPRGFTTEQPATIALDFPNTGTSMSQNVLKFDDKLIKQIEAGQASDRTRLLVSLNQPGQYNAEIKGNEVWVYVQQSAASKNNIKPVTVPQPSPEVSPPTTTTRVFETTSSLTNAALSVNVDFQKGNNDSGMVSITGLSNTTDPIIKREQNSLTLTYKNAPVQAEQQRNLDVADFGTPVQSIKLRRLGNDTQISMQMRGNWDYTQQKRGNNLLVEVSNKFMQTSQSIQNTNKKFIGRRISLDFQDVDVRTILQILAKESGTNIIASDRVTGTMTISLKNVPWDQALDLVLDSRDLHMTQQGNVINIITRTEQSEKEQAAVRDSTQGTLITKSFQLKYRSVEEFQKILRMNDSGKSEDRTILTERGSALIDAGTNTLIITDIDRVIKNFENLISQIDVASQQVLIEARIVETTDGYARELGSKFGYSKWGQNTWGGQVTNGQIMNPKPSADGSFIVNPNINLSVANPSSVVSLVHEFASGALMLELSASQTQGKTKIISSPRVLTQDRKEAKIESGFEVPYQESAASGGTSTSFKDAILGLKVLPQITPEGNIMMTLDVQNDRPIGCAAVDPSIGNTSEICMQKRNVVTQAMIENGGTLIIGGIYNENNENSTSKVPLLGDIPVIGNFFKYRRNVHQRNELLVFITPRIIGSSNSTLKY